MIATTPNLSEMRARHLMSRNVVVIPQEMSLRAAARLLSGAQVSGAPVVDGDGCCVGVLSTTDFMRWTERATAGVTSQSPPTNGICSEWQVVDYEEIPADRVERYMTAEPVTVDAATPVRDLARRMLNAHIHRLIVLDEFHKPVGIVTSTDLVAALARADD
jgi:CBS domain-containing protein